MLLVPYELSMTIRLTFAERSQPTIPTSQTSYHVRFFRIRGCRSKGLAFKASCAERRLARRSGQRAVRLLMLHLGSIAPNAARRKAPVYWGLSVISLAPLAISAAGLMVVPEVEGSHWLTAHTR